MKYKNLPAMSHNFSHSFVSLMNYVDDGYVFEDLFHLARENAGRVISIQWVPYRKYNVGEFSPRVITSIEIKQNWLPNHFEHHRVTEEMITEMRTDIQCKNSGIVVKSYLKDARGKEYVAIVRP